MTASSAEPIPTPRPDAAERRRLADEAIAAGRWADGRAELIALWAEQPTSSTAPFIASRFAKLRGHVPMTPVRLAVLRSFTVEPIFPLATAAAFVGGIDLTARAGEFNAYSQEVLDPGSWIYSWDPTAIVLAIQTRDISPALWERFADLSADDVRREVDTVSAEIVRLIGMLRARTKAHLIVHGLQPPPVPAAGVLDTQAAVGDGQSDVIAEVNRRIRTALRETTSASFLDYAALIARHGADRWEDERKWHAVRLPIAADNLIHLAREWIRYLHPLSGRICKCLISDLDNTLWGGVVGEDGMGGIRMSTDGRGYPYRNLQRTLLDLHRRGILLAIASKNNEADAREALERHPDMLLRPEHFAAMRINWADKGTSLRQIAAELNIGIDSLAFLDDNPVERGWVRRELPEVTVLELPDDPAGFARAVREAPVFERLSLTDEDRRRGEMYAEQRQREELRTGAGSVEEFLRSLDIAVEIAPISPATIERAAQLTQKTNQFNMTTRRYSQEQLAARLAEAGWRGYTLRSTDRFGDNGIVAIAIVHRRPDHACEIDTLLMSCRVIGRTVETAFLCYLATEAKRGGCDRLVGQFLPTKKNEPAASFFPSHSFHQIAANSEGSTWELRLDGQLPQCPPWIRMTATGAE